MIAGQIEIQLLAEIARLKKGLDEAQDLVSRATQRMGAAADFVRGAFAGMAAGLTVGAFVALVRGAIDAAEALNDLSIKSGMTVERLSALQELGRTTGTSAEVIVSATNRLAKAMSGVDDETKGAGAALAALGINVEQFKALKPDDQLLEVAKAMAKFEDGSGKSAVAMSLLGKSGADMLPFLKDLAAANELVATTTTAQAEAADRFNDGVTQLQGQLVALQRATAMALLPTLIDMLDITEKLAAAFGQYLAAGAGDASGEMQGMSVAAQAVGTIFETLMWLGSDVAFVLKAMGREIGGIAAQLVSLLTLDFAGFKAIGDAMKEDGEKARAELDAYQKSILGMTARTAEASRIVAQYGISAKEASGETARLDGRLGAATLATLKFSTATKDASKSAVDAGKKLVADAAARLQVIEQEIEGGEKLTAGQKFALDAMEAIRDGRVKLTDAEKRALVTLLELIQVKEKQVKVDALIAEAQGEAAKLGTKLAATEAEKTEQVRQQLVAEQERLDKLVMTEEALRSNETATMRATAADLEWQAAMEGGNRELEERAQLLRKLADKREATDAAQAVKDINAAQAQAAKDAAQAGADAWKTAAGEISSALTDALMDGGKSGTDYVVGYLRTVLGRAMQGQLMNGIMNATGGTGGWFSQLVGASSGSGGTGGNGALNNLSSLGSAYNTISGWMSAGGTAAAGSSLGAVSAESLYGSMAAYEGITVSGTAAASTAGGTAAAGSSAASAIPIIGWIIAAIMASKGAYESGNTLDMLDKSDRDLGVGKFESDKYDTLSKLGMSDKWAQILSGAPLTARLFGHKASVSGYGYGTIAGGDFQQGQLPMQFGKNVLGGGVDPFMQDLASRIAGGVSVSAGMFGGGLTNGLRVGTMTDRDRENEVASLLGFFGADNKLIAGTQTGSGAFGAGGPGQAAAKIKSEDLDKWIADNLPVVIIQGLQQSDLDARFETYFDSVGAAKLTPQLAQQMLNTATAVAQLTAAFVPIGGVFRQFEGMSVVAFEQLAKTAGGFDALGQTVGAYYQVVYSEAERTQGAWDAIATTLREAGVNTVPKTNAELRALVEGLGDLSDEAKQKAFVALTGVAGAINTLTAASDAAAEQIRTERLGLEGQLLQLQGNSVELRRRERDALDETNRALFDQIQALTDANRIGDERLGLENQLLQLQGNVTELRRRERAQLDESNRALYDQVKALEDQQVAAEKAAQVATKNAEAWRAMQKDALDGVARAYQAVEQMVNSERQRLESEAEKATRDAEQKAEASIRELENQAQQVERLFGGLLDGLAEGIRRLSGELAGDDGRGQAMEVLRNGLSALQAGQTVDVDALRQAAGTASNMGPAGYASEFAYRRDVATTANLLRDISGATRGQRSAQLAAIAEQQVAIEKARDDQITAIAEARDRQLLALDQQLLAARLAAETLIDINAGVQGVGGAIAQLTAAIAAAQRITGGPATPETTGKWVRSGDTEVWGAAGGAVAARPVGASIEGTLIRGLTSTFSQAEGMAWVKDRLGANDIVGIYARAKAEGIDSAALDAMMGWPAGTALRGALEAGLPAFETGTSYVPSTGLAVVHEGERILRAQDNASLMEWMSGGGFGADACTQLAAEIRELRAEVAGMRTDNNAGHRANHGVNAKTAAALENASMGVAPLRTKEVA